MNGREEKVRNNPYESGSGKENSGIMLEAMLAEGTLFKESHQGVSSVGSYTSCPECDATLDGSKTSFEKHFVDHHKEVGYVVVDVLLNAFVLIRSLPCIYHFIYVAGISAEIATKERSIKAACTTLSTDKTNMERHIRMELMCSIAVHLKNAISRV